MADIIKTWLKNPWKLAFPGIFLTAGVFILIASFFPNSWLYTILGKAPEQQAMANYSSVNPYYRGN